MPWVDPHETDPETWGGSAAAANRPCTPVYERALSTRPPFERTDKLVLHGPAVTEEFRTRGYESVRVDYHLAVEADGRVKLLARGHLWGGDEPHQRFRAQYRRESEPTDTVPFDEYLAWTRYQFGTIDVEDGTLSFEPEGDREEETRRLDWTDLYASARLRMAELELIRNPGLARYALRDLGEWRDVEDALRYNPDAFAVGP
ncbi:hypothetical protein [Halorientalis halophila]|uniref:hypothetical protein n=1 Tax=Halorientalis halophila TaxID=3108499 RepID=UPI00300B7877